MDAVQKFIERMADTLAANGWVKGAYHEIGEGYCLRGAQGVVSDELGNELWQDVTERIQKALPDWIVTGPPDPHNWKADLLVRYNDHPNTTYEDIQLLLKKAAEH